MVIMDIGMPGTDGYEDNLGPSPRQRPGEAGEAKLEASAAAGSEGTPEIGPLFFCAAGGINAINPRGFGG